MSGPLVCSCGCRTEIDYSGGMLELTIPKAAERNALHSGEDYTLVTVNLDANAEERLILRLKAQFRERV